MGATTAGKERDVQILTEDISVLPFTAEVAAKAAQIYRQLKSTNQLIEFRDIFIAATCLINDLPIATLNKRHFQRIKELKFI
jgi:tRNA(fMet)-specific endonuclease VapC